MGQLPSTRDRILLAFANLASYGIEAQPALGTDRLTARIHLQAWILARYPAATGSYIFWTALEDQAFDHAGELCRSLTLHHSGDEVARATHAALAQVGLEANPGAARSRIRSRTIRLSSARDAPFRVRCSASGTAPP